MTIIEDSDQTKDNSNKCSPSSNSSTTNLLSTDASSSQLSPPSEETLPSYSIIQAFDNPVTLNPEASKKLAREVRNGTDINYEDFGFEANAEPPSFQEGDARPSYTISTSGNITSHDQSLNSSPAALTRFLRLHSSSPPALTIQIRGSHTETRSTTSYEMIDGVRRPRTKKHEVEVEDFEFTLDARTEVENGLGKARGGGVRGLLYSSGNWEVCHRGHVWKSVGRSTNESVRQGGIRLPDEEEGTEGEKWRIAGLKESYRLTREKNARDRKGLPGFIHPDSLVEITETPLVLPEETKHPPLLFQSHLLDLVETHSSVPFALTGINPPDHPSLVAQREARDSQVRAVVEDYCASTSPLKSLTVRKEVYGWNWESLEAGLRSTIESTRYTGKVQIKFKTSPTSLVIRPMNLSQVFSLPIWAKAILWITLIYPIFLLIEFLSAARFDNLRVAFPLTRWRTLPLPTSTSASSSSTISHSQALTIARSLTSRPPRVAQLPSNGSFVYLIGTIEEEWLRSFEVSIIDAVRRGKRGGELRVSENS